MAELIFFNRTMDCGKSTFALQMNHNHAAPAQAFSPRVLPFDMDVCALTAVAQSAGELTR